MIKNLFVLGAALFATATATAQPGAPKYGKHYPSGNAAVNYIYGSEGMWRSMTNMTFNLNRYQHCGTSGHPYDFYGWLAEANVKNITAGDAYCNLYYDLDNDGEIYDNSPFSGKAFFEHNARGLLDGGSTPMGSPVYNFWYDDNWLARYMAQAYGKTQPAGLYDFGNIVRWRQIGGDNSNWTLYPSNTTHIDQLALNGIYRINEYNDSAALSYWSSILSLSGATWDSTKKQYNYPNVLENYHMGLWLSLTERLLWSYPTNSSLLQHAVSIRSHLLTDQVRNSGGARRGWISSRTDPNSLMNTETISMVVLGLGTGTDFALEPGITPMIKGSGNYFLRSYNTLSAVVGQSSAGHMTYGPYWNLAAGTYDVDFTLRVPGSGGNVVTVDVYDGSSIVGSATYTASSLPAGSWVRKRLTVTIPSTNTTEFRVWWHGGQDLDVGQIRVTKQ